MNEPCATVFIVDDDPGVSAALAWLLEPQGMRIQLYGSALEFLENFQSEQPSCLILDVRMPLIDGFGLLDMLESRKISIPVIMLTGHGDIPMAVRAMKRGIVDFVSKPFAGAHLIATVQAALQKDAAARTEQRQVDSASAQYNSLTARQRETLNLLIMALPNKVIANRLGISVRTVEKHRATIMEKYDAHSIAELMQKIFRRG